MNNNITLFAETNFRNQRRKFGIKTDDRRRHMYIIGKTGVGKTNLMECMAITDIHKGQGLALIDPHGESAEKMLDYVPSNRINDVIYFNPADLNYPIAFNVIEKVDPEYRHLVASGILEVFKKLWEDISWGPRMEYVLRNCILSLLEYPGSTLLGIMRILVDKEYRRKVLDTLTDPVVRSFWIDEFAKYPDRFMAEAVAPIQNKVGQFLTSPLIRNIVGQTKTAINLRDVMDNRKILIVNLSKGKIGEDNSQLLGAMMVTRLQLAAMSRVDIPREEDRKDFYLYVDEFQNFATDSFAAILSEARKYRLNLIVGHQYITQMSEKVRDAIFGNIGTLIVFRVGAADAEFLEKEFTPQFTMNDLVNLSKFNIYLKLMIDGTASQAFSATTFHSSEVAKPEGNREKIIKNSRERYAKDREEVEAKIAKWSGMDLREEPVEEVKPTAPMYDAICSKCGAKTQVIFKPDGKRPVYCKKCLKEVRERMRAEAEKKEATPPQNREERSAPTLSLREAFEREPVTFRPRKGDEEKKRKRKEVDVGELRKVLEESLIQAEKGSGDAVEREGTLEEGKVVRFE